MKRRDPWFRANAPSRAVADLELSGEDATNKNHRRVFTWFASRWRNHQPKRAEKPHSKFSGRKALDGPATRPKTPLAVENGVGKLAAPARVAPNASPGKREWRTPIPHLSLLDRKVGQGLIVFLTSVLVLPLVLEIEICPETSTTTRTITRTIRKISACACRQLATILSNKID